MLDTTGKFGRVAEELQVRLPITTDGLVCARKAPVQANAGTTRPAAKQLRRVYSITSVARSRTEGGMVMPSALAVFMYSTRSKVVGCSIGRSPGLAPLRMRSTK